MFNESINELFTYLTEELGVDNESEMQIALTIKLDIEDGEIREAIVEKFPEGAIWIPEDAPEDLGWEVRGVESDEESITLELRYTELEEEEVAEAVGA